MYAMREAACLLPVLLVVAGCSATRDFVRPSPGTFKLGQTTYSQVIEQMGAPFEKTDGLQNGKPVKTITYAYASKTQEASEPGVTAGRGLTYYFYNDTLVGEQYYSSFKTDASSFDETKVQQITKGLTTRAQVVQLLGQPSATYIPPVVKEPSAEAIAYIYQTIQGSVYTGLKVSTKTLRISFDKNGIVSDIEFNRTTRG